MLRRFEHFALNSISKASRYIVGGFTRALLVESKQGLFLVDPRDSGVGRRIRTKGDYGSGEIERILALTDRESSVLFVGSHVGTLVVPVSKRVRRVCAIEANPGTFQLLQWNLLLNNCTNVTPVHMAASDKEEDLQFVLSVANSGGSKRMPKIRNNAYFYDNPTVTTVPANRLDDVLSDTYDVIVMDIEGSEYFALKGMPRILGSASHLIVEFLPHHLKNVAGVSVQEFLEAVGDRFDHLHIHSKTVSAQKAEFLGVLQTMYDQNEEDDAIVFSAKDAKASN